MTIAPILIITLNRYEHFKRCVESLAGCTHANKTELFIALDYPSKESHWSGYRKILYYLHQITGFKKIHRLKRCTNYGAFKNDIEARKIIYERFDRVILTEDDNEFSPNFLDYINKGLHKFENDHRVLAICGYNYPLEMPRNYKSNYYFYKAQNSWGYATWKKRDLKLFYTNKFVNKLIKSPRFVIDSYKSFGLYHLSKLLLAAKLGKPIYGDRAITSTLNYKNKYCVFPVVSKVRNTGHDGSGVHCNSIENSVYHSQKIDTDPFFLYSDSILEINTAIQAKIRKYFKVNLIGKVKFLIQYTSFLLKK
jgi:hypothetical protein